MSAGSGGFAVTVSLFFLLLHGTVSPQEPRPDSASCEVIRQQAKSCLVSGMGFASAHQPQQADSCYELALRRIGHSTCDSAFFMNEKSELYFYLAQGRDQSGDPKAALRLFSRALACTRLCLGEQSTRAASIFFNIGNIHYLREEFDKALDYFHKSLSIYLADPDENAVTPGTIYNNLGNIYHKTADFGQAGESYSKALEIFRRCLPSNDLRIAMIYNNIGSEKLEKGSCAEALSEYRKAFAIVQDNPAAGPLEKAYSYRNFGNVYLTLGDYSEALKNYEQSRKILEQAFGQRHASLAECYNHIAVTWYSLKDYCRSLRFFQKSLMAGPGSFSDTSIYANPAFDALSSDPAVLRTMVRKAQAFYKLWSEKTDSLADLEASIATYDLVLDLSERIRNEYTGTDSRLFLGQEMKSVYSDAITANLAYQKITDEDMFGKMFRISERSKNFVLRSMLNDLKAIDMGSIPPDLLNHEEMLKRALTTCYTDLQRARVSAGESNGAEVRSLEDRFFLLSRQHDSLSGLFEERFPEYYALKYRSLSVDPEKLSESLRPDEATVEYFVGDKYLFIFTFSREERRLACLPLDDSLTSRVRSHLLSLKLYEPGQLCSDSYFLYHQLLGPVEACLAGKSRLFIIPDDILFLVPFETLIRKPADSEEFPDFSKLDYLVRDYSVSYHYSAALWMDAKNQPGYRKNHAALPPEGDFIGFAPVFKENAPAGPAAPAPGSRKRAEDFSGSLPDLNFSYLPYSEDEVSSIAGLFSGKGKTSRLFIHSGATKENFREKTAGYRIVHVATHGYINDEQPDLSGLAFAPGPAQQKDTDPAGGKKLPANGDFLFSGEMFNLDLDADLVVLSACETGYGKLVRGEGVMAMTRGFLYSGSRNILFSMWKIPDRPTRNLMVNFYMEVLGGADYPAALRNAKLRMISSLSESYPLNWAGFMLIGH